MDKDFARVCLKEIVQIAREDFRPCLMFGSLLGAIREGKFLDNEYDIDLFMIYSDGDLMEAERSFDHLRRDLIERDYEIKDCSTPLFLALKRHDVLIDINLGCFLHDKYVVNSDIFLDVYPAEYFNNLKEIEFEGCKVFIPQDAEGLLEYYYGANWRKHIPPEQYEKEILKTRIWKDGRAG